MTMPRRNQRGFSLLELLVAFSIMAMSLGILYRATGSSARSVGDAERYQHAVMLAQSLLTSRDSVPAGGWNEGGQAGSFSWTVRSAPFETPVSRRDLFAVKLHEIRIAVAWQSGDRERRFELETLLPQGLTPAAVGGRR